MSDVGMVMHRSSMALMALLVAACAAPEMTPADDDQLAGSTAPSEVSRACTDVERIETEVMGDLSGAANPDDLVMGVLLTYAAEHPETFGGLWIDRDAGGTLVLAFTDDAGPHLAEIPPPQAVVSRIKITLKFSSKKIGLVFILILLWDLGPTLLYHRLRDSIIPQRQIIHIIAEGARPYHRQGFGRPQQGGAGQAQH